MDKSKLVLFFITIAMFLMVEFCLPDAPTHCEINEMNKKLVICGKVIKQYRDPKNHNFMEIKLSNNMYLYEKTYFTEIVNLVSVGDSICKPLNSLVFFIRQYEPYFPDTLYVSVELPCDTLENK
jgi:hypothetical protein